MKEDAFVPAYLALSETAELARRVRRAGELLKDCTACPRECHVDRTADEPCSCFVGRHAVVSSFAPHHGEEDPLRGWRGSGTIFFGLCNLRCVFCQNADISQRPKGGAEAVGRTVTAVELAAIMLALQQAGCHNINLVTPEHVVPQILEALPHAIKGGLRLPIVYNTSAYDALESLRLLDGIVDIYMPDFKFWSTESARRFLKAEDYPERAREGIAEMHRQVGDLVLDGTGVAKRGLLLRHLVMPNHADDTQAILEWIAETLSLDTYVNIMDQYRPAHRAGAFEEIDRRPEPSEIAEAYAFARRLGLRRFAR